MKKAKPLGTARIFLLLAAVIVLAGCATTPDGYMQITIKNDTGYPIWYVLISPSSSNTWGADWLDRDEIIVNGRTRKFYLPPAANNEYDFLLEDDEGDRYEKYDVVISRNMVITFTMDDFDLEYAREIRQ